jgi:hypothetical protein
MTPLNQKEMKRQQVVQKYFYYYCFTFVESFFDFQFTKTSPEHVLFKLMRYNDGMEWWSLFPTDERKTIHCDE